MGTTTRRGFLKDTALVAVGVLGGGVIGEHWPESMVSGAAATAETPEQRLKTLGIVLPPAPRPVAIYVPAIVSGHLCFSSGHGPRTADGKMITGRVGDDLSLAEGKAAARVVGLNVLSSVRARLGSLNRVVRLVKVLGMVNATPDFKKHPQVINGFSELMVEVFGEVQGKGARSAVGMGSLPSNIPCEIEAIFEVRTRG